jgi:hypothetical protein
LIDVTTNIVVFEVLFRKGVFFHIAVDERSRQVSVIAVAIPVYYVGGASEYVVSDKGGDCCHQEDEQKSKTRNPIGRI